MEEAEKEALAILEEKKKIAEALEEAKEREAQRLKDERVLTITPASTGA